MITNQIPEAVWQKPSYFIAFGLGVGGMPFAPGTFGTLAAIPFYLGLRNLPWNYYAIFVIAAFFLASYLCHQISKEIGVHDHGGMVIDEYVGYWITMFLAPHHGLFVVLGFVLFRFFDILKPFPINWLDKHVHGGIGIMLDDAVAAIFSCIILQLIALVMHV